MNIQLIDTPKKKLSTIEQILLNREIPEDEINHYVHLSDADINDPESLGEDKLLKGVQSIIKTVKDNDRAIVIVDCDCDGYTSGALIINYLYKIFPTWVKNKLDWSLHENKTHGLSDQIENLLSKNYSLVICPDSSSNDYECHKKLVDHGSEILILDHHLAPKISDDAITINNQLSSYPNKEFSGVGITWQFCRYFDKKLETHYADELLDLVAIGLK